MQNLDEESFLMPSSIGEVIPDCATLVTLVFSILSVSLLLNSGALVVPCKRLSLTGCIYAQWGQRHVMFDHVMSIWPKRLSFKC